MGWGEGLTDDPAGRQLCSGRQLLSQGEGEEDLRSQRTMGPSHVNKSKWSVLSSAIKLFLHSKMNHTCKELDMTELLN